MQKYAGKLAKQDLSVGLLRVVAMEMRDIETGRISAFTQGGTVQRCPRKVSKRCYLILSCDLKDGTTWLGKLACPETVAEAVKSSNEELV